jgi:peptide/nickel transport system substrate-binding protein
MKDRTRSFAATSFGLGVLAVSTIFASCSAAPSGCAGDHCGTLVFAAPGEPSTLLPAISDEALDRDIFDQLFLKLADIGDSGNTVGDKGFVPQLADRWGWSSPLTLTFHLDPRAHWHDGLPVRASDVVFTWDAYTDSTIDSPDRENLRHIKSVIAPDSATVAFTFDRQYPEMFFDAAYHMRILPAHLLQSVPHAQWHAAAFGRAPVGDGPYRFVRWTAGQSVELAADSAFFLGRPGIRRLIWRFTTDLTVAVTQVVAGDADAIQVLVTPANLERATNAKQLALYPYPGSVYTLLAFNLRANGDRSHPHPVLGDPDVRRALVLATDRVRMAQSVFAGHASVPPGPLSKAWSDLWFADIPVPAYDTVAANHLLDHGGWLRGADGMRARNGTPLAFHIAVPSSSGTRKQYAQLIQEELRAVGVAVVIDEVEAATMQDKERSGAYDAALESWNTDPSPAPSISEAWLSHGPANFGRYSNPVFDQQVARAVAAIAPDSARAAWHDALATLAVDSPAIMLYALDNVAAVDRRVTNVTLRPDYWWAHLREWRIPADKLSARDRVEH